MKRLICFGDSNTYGFDPRSYIGSRYEEADRWTGIIKEETGMEVINEGMPGRKIPRPAYDINDYVAMLSIQCQKNCNKDTGLFIMLGSNDLLDPQHPSAELVAGYMKDFLTALLHSEPFCHGSISITLISPPQMKPGTWTDTACIQEASRIGTCMKKLAEDLGISFLDAGTWDLPLCFDGVHLTEEGHHRFAEHVLQYL